MAISGDSVHTTRELVRLMAPPSMPEPFVQGAQLLASVITGVRRAYQEGHVPMIVVLLAQAAALHSLTSEFVLMGQHKLGPSGAEDALAEIDRLLGIIKDTAHTVHQNAARTDAAGDN